MQQGTLPTRLVQFVVADAVAYKTEKDRALAITGNSPMLERPYLFSVMDSFYKLREKGTGELLERVYLNESSSCHAPIIEPGGKISATKFGDYDSSQCNASLDYTLGFVEGVFLGSTNATNWLQCGLDNGQQDGKLCRKRWAWREWAMENKTFIARTIYHHRQRAGEYATLLVYRDAGDNYEFFDDREPEHHQPFAGGKDFILRKWRTANQELAAGDFIRDDKRGEEEFQQFI
jgi:hypothetical protein